MRSLLRLFLFFGLATAGLVRGEEPFQFEKTPGKLPKHIRPQHYELQLKPDLDSLTVSGHETIDIEITKTTGQIVLNALNLEVSSARILGGSTLQVQPVSTNQLLTLAAPGAIAPGRYQLDLSFRGQITEAAAGMFFIDYSAPSGKKRMVATQFEATDARRVFPCFDEPAFRATFGLTAEIPARFKAVSNMPVARSGEATNGWRRVQFQSTPAMPTYLLVLVAGELEEIHARAGQTETRVWFTEGKQPLARYALENSQRILKFYNSYFGIRFPLPKLDHIAMPGGFGGAMEHWGAITYNESAILYDPRKSSHDQKERSFSVQAHEMAHQWFGNLVTMAWWDNLWLNEGFASWMENKAADLLNPDWKVWARAEGQKLGLMARDARKSTHPIQRPVMSEAQIGDAFDDITYGKGMLFIRMLEDYTGDQAFREGLRRYMKRHAFSNTTTADLWAALAASSHKPIADFAAGWTEQPGLPIVLAQSRCSGGKQEVVLQQERFTLLDPGAMPLRWRIPVKASDIASGQISQLEVGNTPVTFALGSCEAPVKLNFGGRGYYHIAYSRPMFERLRSHWNGLSETDRVNFLGDAWAMVESGRLTAEEYLDILPTLAQEKSLAVWEQLTGTLGQIHLLLMGQAALQTDFQRRTISLLHPIASRLGYAPRSGEPATEGVLRARLLGLLGSFGDPEVIAWARQRFELFLRDATLLTGDLRAVALDIVGQNAATSEYERIVNLAKAAPLEEDQRLLLSAASQARDPELARRTLDLSLAKAFTPIQSASLVASVSGTGLHAQAAWDFMKAHYRELLALVGGPFENMYASSTVGGFTDEAHAVEYLDFVRANLAPDAMAKAEEAADGIRYRAYLKGLILPSVEKWARQPDLR